MKKLSELTLIVPSYGRHDYLLRLIDFWSNTPVRLKILDGSEHPCQEAARFCSNDRMSYYHLPFSIYERFAYASQLIDTPYAVFLGDDEFYVPSALCSCIRKIEQENLVACGGLALAFYHHAGCVYGRKRYPEMKGLLNDSPDARSRIIKSVTPVVPSVIYAVHRSEVFKNNLKIFNHFDSSCPGTSEVQFTLMTCLQGATRIINELYWLRSCENSSVATVDWDTQYHFHEWYKDPAKKEEVDSFFRGMLNAASCLPTLDLIEVHHWFEEAVNVYIQSKIERKKNMRKADVITHHSMALARYLPSSITQIIRPIYNKAMTKFGYDWHKEFKPISEAAAELTAEGTMVDFNQLELIVEKICSFHTVGNFPNNFNHKPM